MQAAASAPSERPARHHVSAGRIRRPAAGMGDCDRPAIPSSGPPIRRRTSRRSRIRASSDSSTATSKSRPESARRITGGHTSGQQALFIESDGQTAVYLADACPTWRHLPSLWCMSYDMDLLQARRIKPILLGEIADRGWLALSDHDPDHAAARLVRDPKREFRGRRGDPRTVRVCGGAREDRPAGSLPRIPARSDSPQNEAIRYTSDVLFDGAVGRLNEQLLSQRMGPALFGGSNGSRRGPRGGMTSVAESSAGLTPSRAVGDGRMESEPNVETPAKRPRKALEAGQQLLVELAARSHDDLSRNRSGSLVAGGT